MAPEASPAPTTSTGLTRCTDDDLLRRLLRLADQDLSGDRAPICTYTTTPTEHGEVYQATRQFIDWLRRQIPGYGIESPIGQPAAGRAFGGKGEIPVNL